MTHTTFNLYRTSSLIWAWLPYKHALILRIKKAEQAMLYYKNEADKITDKFGPEYNVLVKKRNASDDAKKWNQIFLDEIEQEKQDQYQNYKNKTWALYSKWRIIFSNIS